MAIGRSSMSVRISSSYIGNVGCTIHVQLPLAPPQEQLNRTEILLVHVEMLLKLSPRECLEIRPRLHGFGSSCSQAASI